MRIYALLASVALTCGTSALAQDRSDQRYAIEATVADNGSVIAKPRLVVEQGETARIEIWDRPDRRYAIALTAKPLANGRLELSTIIDVASPTSGKLDARPVLEVAPGTVATVELGEDCDRAKPFRLEVKLSSAAQ